MVGKRQRSCYAIDLKLKAAVKPLRAGSDKAVLRTADHELAWQGHTGKNCRHRTDMPYYERRTLAEEEDGDTISSNSGMWGVVSNWDRVNAFTRARSLRNSWRLQRAK